MGKTDGKRIFVIVFVVISIMIIAGFISASIEIGFPFLMFMPLPSIIFIGVMIFIVRTIFKNREGMINELKDYSNKMKERHEEIRPSKKPTKCECCGGSISKEDDKCPYCGARF